MHGGRWSFLVVALQGGVQSVVYADVLLRRPCVSMCGQYLQRVASRLWCTACLLRRMFGMRPVVVRAMPMV